LPLLLPLPFQLAFLFDHFDVSLFYAISQGHSKGNPAATPQRNTNIKTPIIGIIIGVILLIVSAEPELSGLNFARAGEQLPAQA
jgi:hypothetical protein